MNSFESPAVALAVSWNENVSLQLPVQRFISKPLYDKNKDKAFQAAYLTILIKMISIKKCGGDMGGSLRLKDRAWAWVPATTTNILTTLQRQYMAHATGNLFYTYLYVAWNTDSSCICSLQSLQLTYFPLLFYVIFWQITFRPSHMDYFKNTWKPQI